MHARGHTHTFTHVCELAYTQFGREEGKRMKGKEEGRERRREKG